MSESADPRKNFVSDTHIFSILYYCGLRRSELLNLNWDDVNLGSKITYARSAKNKPGRVIPMQVKVHKLLELS
jgi:integrase/recombinase XerD